MNKYTVSYTISYMDPKTSKGIFDKVKTLVWAVSEEELRHDFEHTRDEYDTTLLLPGMEIDIDSIEPVRDY